MAFRAIQTLPDNPPVRIFFHGLALLRSDNGRDCLAELHRESNSHTLSIEVRTKEEGKPDLILLRRFNRLNGNTQMGIRVIPALPMAEQGAFKYVPFDVNPFTTTPTDQNRPDFGWIVNLASRHYHGQALGVRRSGTRPGLTISGGDCRLYTAAVTDSDITVRRRRNPPAPQQPEAARQLSRLASLIGANLYMGTGAGTRVEVTIPGFPTLTLPRPAAARISYEIYIENSPLFADVEHDELMEYYRVVRKGQDDSGVVVPEEEQFLFKFTQLNPGFVGSAKVVPERASARIPCQSIVLDS